MLIGGRNVVHIAPEINPFVLNWLDASSIAGSWPTEFRSAIRYLSMRGCELGPLPARNASDSRHGEDCASAVGRSVRHIRWGDAVSL